MYIHKYIGTRPHRSATAKESPGTEPRLTHGRCRCSVGRSVVDKGDHLACGDKMGINGPLLSDILKCRVCGFYRHLLQILTG